MALNIDNKRVICPAIYAGQERDSLGQEFGEKAVTHCTAIVYRVRTGFTVPREIFDN